MHFSQDSVRFLQRLFESNKMKSDGKKLSRTQNLWKNGSGALQRYILQSWHQQKLKMHDRKPNIKKCVAQNIP